MSETRNNHYVPEWYQKGFFEHTKNPLAYLDLVPPSHALPDGRTVTGRALFDSPVSRAFRQRDLYSTFFGTVVNDEIERRLFGDIDTRGAKAIRAFVGGDPVECHQNFESLFEYIDIQKIRTPKGLDWLRAQYPSLTQNDLMLEMQGIRMMHCTIWTEGVREIVSAEDSDIKFIVSDHPVTVYNPAAAPDSEVCKYPGDPAIELKGTQTVFPLNRDFCLILTNLEFAQDPNTDPLQKRTFPRRFRSSMVRTDAFIRSRKLCTDEVTQINTILRSRSRRYIAAGRKEWIPTNLPSAEDWKHLGRVLLPPQDEIASFGGELFAKFEDGHVHYQDAFGRTEKERKFLRKEPISGKLRPRDPCGCGSGETFGNCCQHKPAALRPSWNELSIRERNLALFRGVTDILGLESYEDWTEVRRNLTDEKIKQVYALYEALWPLETDLLSLLPKPDGVARAVYTGVLHPSTIVETAFGSTLLFGELLIQHPFLNPGTVREEFNPVKNPQSYRQEFVKSVLLFLQVMPLVEIGLVNLIPDPWEFDYHLRDQTMRLAEERSDLLKPLIEEDSRLRDLVQADFKRSLLLSDEDQRALIRQSSPDLDDRSVDNVLKAMSVQRENDPLAVLQDGASLGSEEGGQLSTFKLAPNFEMAMYIAQATGSCIVTDNLHRWREIQLAIHLRGGVSIHHLSELAKSIQDSTFSIPQDVNEICTWSVEGRPRPHPRLMRDVFRYLSKVDQKGAKPNYEQHLTARFQRAQNEFETAIQKAKLLRCKARIQCLFPKGGIYDSTITRLLLMSSSELHLPAVPMAFFIKARSS